MVDELGKITMMGGIDAHKAGVNAVSGWTGTLIAGYGLFYFSHDRTGAEDSGSSEALTGDNYLAIYDGNDGQVWIYSEAVDDAGGTGWDDKLVTGGGVIDIGSSNTTTAQVNYYVVDGTLRVCDGLHTNSNTPQWYGYIKRIHFPGLTPGGSVDSYDGWFAKDQEIAAPTTGLVSEINEGILGTTSAGDATTLTDDAGSGAFANFTAAQIDGKGYIAYNHDTNTSAVIEERDNANSLGTASTDDWYPGNSETYTIHPAAGTGWNIFITAVGSGGNWAAEDYELATTFIYDGNQESLPFETGGGFTLVSNGYPKATVMVTSPYNPRITGGRAYYRIADSSDDWKLLLDIDLYKGTQGSGEGGWRGWTLIDGGATADAVSILMDNDGDARMVTQDLVNTYEVLNEYSAVYGLPSFTSSLIASYKTSVVANRMTYIGDALIKSPVNKFDTFPLSRILETSVRDGDEIIKLEAYADRILVFKKHKLELLNVSQEIEFLEDTFMHKGVSHPAATCKTDFGIAWVNNFGCYLYDGQKVNNLLEKQGRQIIKEGLWSTFTALEPMIGYIPKKRQLLIANDVTTTGDGAAYLYDLVTQSWVKGAAGTITSEDKTNFVTDWDGDLIYAHTTGTVVKWDDASDTSAGLVITTKDIDFGNPGQKKTVYKVLVTYKTADSGTVTSNVQLDYGVDGDHLFPYDFTVPELPAANGWETATMIPDVPSEASNIRSIRIRFATDGTVPVGFEINDISIVYRLKGVR